MLVKETSDRLFCLFCNKAKKLYFMERSVAFLLFFSIVLTIYFFGNYYIYLRGMQAIPDGSPLKSVFPWLFWLLAASYVAGRMLEHLFLSTFSDILVWIGSFWLGALFYLFITVVFVDMLRLINLYLPFFPGIITENMIRVR